MTTISLYYSDDLAWAYGRRDPAPSYSLVHTVEVEVAAKGIRRDGPPVDVPVGAVPDDVLDGVLCDLVWRAFNRGSDMEDAALDEKHLRSISMGDILKIVDAEDPDYAEHARLKAEGHLPEPCGPSCPTPHYSRAYLCVADGWEPIESWKIAPASAIDTEEAAP